MNYFFDTEFIEGKQPKKFLGIQYGETKPLVDLISIGVVSEDNREYYEISKDFNVDHAWNDDWIRKNVLLKIYTEHVSGDQRNRFQFTKDNFKTIVKNFGKPNKQIAAEILMFVHNTDMDGWLGSSDEFIGNLLQQKPQYPFKFWAYYASTDWVAFYQLWGKMIDSPRCYPMYVSDLKNLMDFKGLTKEWKQEHCPDPKQEHNALADARWNKKLYDLITEL